MFGQQPQQQYGYPQQGYPQQQAYSQQQYGGYQPAPMAPKMSAEQMLNQIDSQSGKSAFTKDSMPGTRVTGIIENVTANQVRDFQTKQPAFWNDGSCRYWSPSTPASSTRTWRMMTDAAPSISKGGACSAAHGCRHCTTPV